MFLGLAIGLMAVVVLLLDGDRGRGLWLGGVSCRGRSHISQTLEGVELANVQCSHIH